MIKHRDFVWGDLLHIDPKDIYDVAAKQRFFGLIQDRKSISFTILTDDGDILACVSFFKIHEKTAEISMLCGENFLKYKIEFIKTLKAGTEKYMQEFGLHRVQCTIKADFYGADHWIEILGYEKEAVLKKYGPDGEDHFLFAKVSE